MPLGIQPLVGKAAQAYSAPLARLNVYDGAVRSSKTITSILRWARWVREDAPPGTLMLAGKTERTIKQNVIDPLVDIFGEKHAKYRGGAHELILFGRRHIIIGANDARAETKIRGITLAGAYGDEVTLWPETFFKMMLSRLSPTGSSFIGTTNPDSPAHWLNRDYLQRAQDLGLKRWVFKLTDNPHLPPEYVKALELEYTGLWRKRYLDGLWVVAEGAIYDMLDPALHQVEELPKLVWTMACADYGTTNPSVFLALSLGEDNRLYVHNEWRHDSRQQGRQMTMAEYSQHYFAWRDQLPQLPEKFWVDPSANSFILQVWRDGEKHIAPADNDVRAGIMETAALLGSGRLLFHAPTTKLTWEEMASYVWDSAATLKGEDKPMKVFDHGPDALRYGVRGSRLRWKRLVGNVELPTASKKT